MRHDALNQSGRESPPSPASPEKERIRQRLELSLTPVERSLPEHLTRFLARFPDDRQEVAYTLPDLALALGCRLPEQAQTITFWQRGELGRSLRRAGYSIRVELARVIFVRRTTRRRTED